jgi:hypothetical protein
VSAGDGGREAVCQGERVGLLDPEEMLLLRAGAVRRDVRRVRTRQLEIPPVTARPRPLRYFTRGPTASDC